MPGMDTPAGRTQVLGTRAVPRRPVLLRGVRRLWRDANQLQLGMSPRQALILQLPDPSSARVLDLIDGTRSEPEIVAQAAAFGCTPAEMTDLLRALVEAGYVTDLDDLQLTGLAEPARRRLIGEAAALALGGVASGGTLRRRQAARILITGNSQLAVPIACALACSGIGRIDIAVTGTVRPSDATPAGLLPADAYRPRRIAAADAVRRCAPDVDLSPLRPGEATFVVLAGRAEPAALTALSLATRQVAHLAVWVRDSTVVVGPLVWPGITACLNCLDLCRKELDPAWPRISAQLVTGPCPAEPVTAVTALTATGYATAQVLAHVDRAAPVAGLEPPDQIPATLAATVEITGTGVGDRRQWRAHPECGCVASASE
jgi:hypothetical protein